MKRIVTIILLLSAVLSAGAADFFVDTPAGQRLYYKITSATTVQLVAPMSGISWTGYATPVGRLEIPATVTHEGTTYSVTAVDKYAFSGCGELTSVTLSDNIQSVGRNAFASDTMLTSFHGGHALKSIGMMAFYSCSRLDTIELPGTLTDIGTAAFNGCGYMKNSENWSADSLLAIGQYVISVSNYRTGDVVVPDGILGLANGAFYNCPLVETATMPGTLRFIGSHCFQDCFALDTVRLLGTIPPALTDDIFFSIDPCTVAVPCSTLATYQAAPFWSGYPLVEDTCATPPVDPNSISTPGANGLAFSVRPNPATDRMVLTLGQDVQSTGAILMLYSLDGRILLRQAIDGSYTETILDVSHLPAGTYIMRVVTPSATASKRVVIAR